MVRRVGLALLLALALVLLLIGGVFGLAQTGYGKRMIASRLGDLLSTPEMAVEITGLQGTVPIDMRLDRVTVADPDGVWLEVDDARLAWSPGALLRGRIRIDELSAARIDLDRLPPSEPAPEPGEPFRLPELPAWLPPTTVQQLSVAKLDLGEGVLGQPASFTLSGHLGTAEDGGSADAELALERIDQPTASVTLDATLGLAPATLDLAVKAKESGGLLAALTGQADAKAFTLSLTGKGPLDDWKGDLQVDAQALAQADATIGMALDDTLRLSLDGDVAPAPGLLPENLAAVVGEQIGLDVAIAQTGPQELTIERLRVATAAAELSGKARADLDSDDFRAEASLAVADLGALEGLVGEKLGGSMRLEITADGKLQQPQGSVRLQGSGLAFGAITAERLATSIDFAAREPLSAGLRGLQLSGSGGVEGLDVPQIAPLPLDGLDWQIDVLARQEDAVDVNLVRLSTSDIAMEVRGEIDPQTLAAAGQVDLTVGSLARLAAPFDQPVDGALHLHADVVAAEQARQIDARLTGTLDRLTGLPPGAAELLGSKVQLTTTAAIRPASEVRITDLALEGAAMTLSGALAMTLPDNLDGALSLDLPRLAVLEPLLDQKLGGALEVDAVLSGSMAAPEVELAAQTRDLRLAGRAIEKLALLATAQGLPAEPAGKVELAVATGGIEASLAAPYRLQGQTLVLPELALRAPRARIDGALTIDLERTLVDGTLRGRVQDLAGLQPLLPMPLQGAVDLDATLRPDAARQTVQLSLAVRDLVAGFGRLRRLEANATVTDALGDARLEARASAQDFRQGTLHLARAQVEASGTREQLAVRSSMAGEAPEPFDLEARADVVLAEALRVRLEQLSGEVAAQPLRLMAPAEVTLGEQELRLSGLDLRLAGARLTADASLAGGQVAADVTLEDLSLATLAELGAPDLTGEAGAHLQMSGAVGDPRATLDLTITDLRAADPIFDDLPAARLTATAELAARRLRLDLRGEGVTDKPLVLAAELPLVLQLQPFVAQMPPDGPISGRLDAEIQLVRLEEVAGLDDDRLEGLLDAGLSVAGTVQDPQLDGTVEITGGIYENGLTGTVLHDLTLRARGRQQRLTIEELSANDGGSGRITGQGFVEVDPAASFPFDISLSLESARLVQTNEADATLGGRLRLAGDASASSLTGQVEVERADIRIPDQVGPSIPTIEVVEIGGSAPPSAGNGAGGGTAFKLGLDVVVNLPGRVFVRGRGLESEWEGRIEAKGTASEPRLTGQLRIRRGTFDLLDRRFTLRRGVITFKGTSPPNPQIDIEAVAQTSDITAIVRIGGTAKQPTIALDSQPPLPEDEVLSRLMFNRPASSITPLQAVQLAAAVNRLRGGGVLDTLRTAIGVDTLDISGGAGGSPGATVRAGKYLAEGVYVEGETGTASQSSKARVEVEILPNLSLQAETGTNATGGVGIKWQYDY